MLKTATAALAWSRLLDSALLIVGQPVASDGVEERYIAR